LIEDSGLKGLSVGGAQVSEKHSGFIVNTGNATASDVVELVRLVRERVYMDTGVVLEPEVKWIGGEKTCSF
jgi:UDP-N-acetylmuramate dehydrogenase